MTGLGWTGETHKYICNKCEKKQKFIWNDVFTGKAKCIECGNKGINEFERIKNKVSPERQKAKEEKDKEKMEAYKTLMKLKEKYSK